MRSEGTWWQRWWRPVEGADEASPTAYPDESPDRRPNAEARLTPDAVRRFAFRPAGIGRRGIEEEDVRRLQSLVLRELAAGAAERDELRVQYQRQRVRAEHLQDSYRRHNSDLPVPSDGFLLAATIATDEAVALMSRAQQEADRQIADAEDLARGILATARQRYEEMLVAAHEQAERAAAEVGRLDPSSPSQEQVRSLKQRIAYMRTFATETQARLSAALDALSTDLENMAGESVPAEPQEQRERQRMGAPGPS